MTHVAAPDTIPANPDGPRRGVTARRIVLAALFGLVLLVGTWAAWFFTIDDAFITYRYSANLANGHGPVWNTGEDPVEGFTNFAWMVAHVPAVWLSLPLETVSKVVGLACSAASGWMLITAADRPGTCRGGLVAAGSLLVFVPTYFHLTSGLETMAFAAVVLRAVVLGVRVLDGAPVRSWELPLVLLLAGTLRPEGIAAVLPAVAVWFVVDARRDRKALLFTAAAAALGAGYFAWRWAYFGHVFPNTFYVKFGNAAAGLTWAQTTALLLAPLLLLTASLLVSKSTRKVGSLLALTVVATFAVYMGSGLTMDYVGRFAMHAVPVLCLGAGIAVSTWRPRGLAASAGAFAVGWMAVAGWQMPDLPVVTTYGPDLQRTHVAIGRGLAAADVPTQDRRLAVSDAGAIPYYSGWSTIDYIGLNNEPVAHGENVNDVVRVGRPTVVVVTNSGPGPRAEAYGLDLSALTTGYERVAAVQMREGYWQLVYAAPEWAEPVRQALIPVVDEAQRRYDPGRYDLTFDRWADRLRTQLPF